MFRIGGFKKGGCEMSCDKKDKNLKTCELEQFERNNYFYGKLMTVRDFEAEQDYFNNKRYLINRMIHGIGIVCGLKVEDNSSVEGKKPQKDKTDSWSVYLNPGVALDCCGHEIVVNTGGLYTVNGTFSEKSNGLYLRYDECQKETVLGLSNLSNCEEECCPARIGETFTLEWGPLPKLTEISGKVKAEKVLVPGALVQVLRNGTVIGSTVTNNKGEYYLKAEISSKKDKTPYILRVSTSAHELVEKEVLQKDITRIKDINLGRPHEVKDPADLKKNISQKYYEGHLTTCPKCDDAKVLLAVFAGKQDSLELDKKTTYEYREIVYNNPMLYDLLSTHLVDFTNPHNVTALQTGALVSINEVMGSKDKGDLKLVNGNNIIITPEKTKNQITISSTADTDQLENVFLYLRERALKCALITFRALNKKFSENEEISTIFGDFSEYFAKQVKNQKYKTPDGFIEVITHFLDDNNLHKLSVLLGKLNAKGYENFRLSLKVLTEALKEGDQLKIAASMDKFCLYASLLELNSNCSPGLETGLTTFKPSIKLNEVVYYNDFIKDYTIKLTFSQPVNTTWLESLNEMKENVAVDFFEIFFYTDMQKLFDKFPGMNIPVNITTEINIINDTEINLVLNGIKLLDQEIFGLCHHLEEGSLEGIKVFLRVKCDFIKDINGKAVAGHHLYGRNISGLNMVCKDPGSLECLNIQGGIFETWFYLVSPLPM